VLFASLARYDDRFGRNDPIARVVEGWHHPALRTFIASKGCRDQHDLGPQDLAAIAWNLEKKLAQFQAEEATE
jgi:hypothetical protein